MPPPRVEKSIGNSVRGCKRSWRDGLVLALLQIVTFFGLCYLLIVFHYELVQSKQNERAISAQLSQLKSTLQRIENSQKGTNSNTKKEVIKKGQKYWYIFQGRGKRETAGSKGVGAIIHLVASPDVQRISPGYYVKFKHDCAEICQRGDNDYRIESPDTITVVHSGVYFIYAQVEYRGDFEMSHYIEIGTKDDAQKKTFFKGSGKYKYNMTNLVSGVAFLRENWKIRVGVSFKGESSQIFVFNQEQTYVGLYRISKDLKGS